MSARARRGRRNARKTTTRLGAVRPPHGLADWAPGRTNRPKFRRRNEPFRRLGSMHSYRHFRWNAPGRKNPFRTRRGVGFQSATDIGTGSRRSINRLRMRRDVRGRFR